MKRISVVVPTINPDQFAQWRSDWDELLLKHQVSLFTVFDGPPDQQRVSHSEYHGKAPIVVSERKADELLGEDRDLICQLNSSSKNLGLFAAAIVGRDIVMVFDDDTAPIGDTIQGHLDILEKRVPISWLATTDLEFDPPMRGFPYNVREEAPVFFSHGVWEGFPDLDAPTALAYRGREVTPTFYRGPVPRGIYAPICGMNIAFRRELLPYVYFAPTSNFEGAQRFDDIWMGIHLVETCARQEWAIYTGGATVRHGKQSDLWANLRKEIVGLQEHEHYWRPDFDLIHANPWFREYDRKRKCWQELVSAECSVTS